MNKKIFIILLSGILNISSAWGTALSSIQKYPPRIQPAHFVSYVINNSSNGYDLHIAAISKNSPQVIFDNVISLLQSPYVKTVFDTTNVAHIIVAEATTLGTNPILNYIQYNPWTAQQSTVNIMAGFSSNESAEMATITIGTDPNGAAQPFIAFVTLNHQTSERILYIASLQGQQWATLNILKFTNLSLFINQFADFLDITVNNGFAEIMYYYRVALPPVLPLIGKIDIDLKNNVIQQDNDFGKTSVNLQDCCTALGSSHAGYTGTIQNNIFYRVYFREKGPNNVYSNPIAITSAQNRAILEGLVNEFNVAGFLINEANTTNQMDELKLYLYVNQTKLVEYNLFQYDPRTQNFFVTAKDIGQRLNRQDPLGSFHIVALIGQPTGQRTFDFYLVFMNVAGGKIISITPVSSI